MRLTSAHAHMNVQGEQIRRSVGRMCACACAHAPALKPTKKSRWSTFYLLFCAHAHMRPKEQVDIHAAIVNFRNFDFGAPLQKFAKKIFFKFSSKLF